MVGGENKRLEIEFAAHDVHRANLLELRKVACDGEGLASTNRDADGQDEVVARLEYVGDRGDSKLSFFDHCIDARADQARREVQLVSNGFIGCSPIFREKRRDASIGLVHFAA